jgi:Iron only nitrogenase protein AnfO (AnfO_nitrog).
MDRIALAVGLDGKLAEFFSVKEILIYEKQAGWAMTDHFPADTKIDTRSTTAVRQIAVYIGKSILERSCQYLVGREIVGIPYHTLCRAGLEIFEADEINEALFDAIFEDFIEEKNVIEEEADIVPPRPIPTDDEGNYYLDFIWAAKCNPDLSSKKMLLPFFENDLFYSLVIRCDHLMPWLEHYGKENALNLEAKQENGVCQILITHKCCKE